MPAMETSSLQMASRIDVDSGIGLYCPRNGTKEIVPWQICYSVPSEDCSHYKMYPNFIGEEAVEGECIRICSDSQATLKALCAPNFTSRLV